MPADTNDLIEQQKEYYRARAGEYDEWFLREGRYDRGPEHRAQWWAEVDEVRAALERFNPAGRVLELACGTGWWTEQLVRWADEITAVDASSEVLELNRIRVGDEKVRRVQADLFQWTPEPAAYDVVFFSFWLSHVPPERFGDFWEMVRGALKPGGRAFFVDSLRTVDSTAKDHVLPDDDVVLERKLNDGRRFNIYKVFYHPADLAAKLADIGWRAEVKGTASFFLYGHAIPA
ncbi:MAG TPA: class I SAM-dependent methyltransferase [Longimicrobium sp.]|nr:class I SAM-dependent methyltransferase [Longimicrobium sp.]